MNPYGSIDRVFVSVSDRVAHRVRSGVDATWHSLMQPTVSHGAAVSVPRRP